MALQKKGKLQWDSMTKAEYDAAIAGRTRPVTQGPMRLSGPDYFATEQGAPPVQRRRPVPRRRAA